MMKLPGLCRTATITSLIVTMLCVGLLARGLWARDYVTWSTRNGRFVEIDSFDGYVTVSVIHSDAGRSIKWQVVSRDACPFPSAVLFGHPSYRTRDLGLVLIDTSNAGALLDRRERSPVYPIARFIWHWGMV